MPESPSAEDFQLERQGRRLAEQRAEQLRGEVAFYKSELTRLQQGVRYQLGDAVVRALHPSRDTLKLPGRLWRLLLRGLRQSAERRRESDAVPSAEPVPLTRPTFRPHALVAEPFGLAPPELRRRRDLKIAALTDEFSWWAWQFEAEVYTFTPADWRRVLEENPPDLLLVESCWRGPGESWHYQVRELGAWPAKVSGYVLPDVVAWCQRRGIPTVFYNKEDPPNFDVFLPAARLFDWVFTSDANCVPAYVRELGHDRVRPLAFAAQPRLHNPLRDAPPAGSVCFAGTWYQHRHHGRRGAADVVLRPALDFGLHIFDRVAGSADPNYHWPPAYRAALRGSLPYAEMLDAYKRYQVFLNINSVSDSPTMFARRVFELLACGTPVISSWSLGLEQMLGDVVLLSNDETTTRRHLERLLGDEEYRARLSLLGRRRVFHAHTYTHRLQAILDAAGPARPPLAPARLAMLACVESADDIAAARATFERQAYTEKSLLLAAVRPGLNDAVTRPTWGAALAAAVEHARADWIVALHPADTYGPAYLTDYAHATLYVPGLALGKLTEPGGLEHGLTPQVAPWTLCVAREVAARYAVQSESVASPRDWWQGLLEHCGQAYAADRFNHAPAGANALEI